MVSLAELNIETVEQLSLLEPFGQGNKDSVAGHLRRVTMCDRAAVGKTGDHMRFTATDGSSSVPAIMFRVSHIDELVNCDSVVDLVVEAVAERWQGRVKPKLMVKDILCRTCQRPPRGPSDKAPAAGGAGSLRVLWTRNPCRHRSPRVRTPWLERCSSPSATAGRAWPGFPIRSSPAPSSTRASGPLARTAPRCRRSMPCRRRNTLIVMGTGRGKSMVFHVHAAREAVLRGRASVFVYPLRALVADQSSTCVRFCQARHRGRRSHRSHGPGGARPRVCDIARESIDIVLTTPEFLAIHAGRFAATGRVGFAVVDEAHHVEEGLGVREALIWSFPACCESSVPLRLAATATATERTVRQVGELLGIENVVVDDAVRDNLRLDDERDLSSRENRLVSMSPRGRNAWSTLIRATSPSRLRARCVAVFQSWGSRSLFTTRAYPCPARRAGGGGVSRREVTCVVSTSAFGEGVNLPDVRHVVLYHMPFCATEFNQMSGRAGRDGSLAQIHLLYSSRDARINERLLDAAAPQRDELVTLVLRPATTARRLSRGDGRQAHQRKRYRYLADVPGNRCSNPCRRNAWCPRAGDF